MQGRRLVARVPYGHWKTMTFLAALRCDCIDSPCVFDGPVNAISFTAYVEKFLVSTFGRVTLSSSTIWAATRARRFVAPSMLSEQGCCSRRLTAQTEPDRTGLCQAQASDAQSRRTNRRDDMETHRQIARLLQTRRVLKISRQCRIRFKH